jgi:O-succinylbenzoate synthase
VQLRLRGSNLSSYLNGVFGRPGAEIATWSAVVSVIGADGGNRGSEEITAEVESALRSGATLVKLKVNEHTDIAAAAALVREVSRRVRGDEVDVAADANRSLPIDRAEAIERADLTYIEEPLLSGVGLDALRKFRSQSSTPVALDESISDVAALELALQAGAVDRVSVKPARLGGTARTAALAMAAEAAGVGWFVGGMFELGVGRATALCLAAQSGLPTDLGPNWRYVERDICAPVDSAPEGNLVVPQWAPLGVESLQLEDPAWIVDRVVLHS